jgi:hypothetical protein
MISCIIKQKKRLHFRKERQPFLLSKALVISRATDGVLSQIKGLHGNT